MSATNSTLSCLIDASLKAALLHLCTMRDTHSSLLGWLRTSLMVTPLDHLRHVCDTNSAPNGFTMTADAGRRRYQGEGEVMSVKTEDNMMTGFVGLGGVRKI